MNIFCFEPINDGKHTENKESIHSFVLKQKRVEIRPGWLQGIGGSNSIHIRSKRISEESPRNRLQQRHLYHVTLCTCKIIQEEWLRGLIDAKFKRIFSRNRLQF